MKYIIILLFICAGITSQAQTLTPQVISTGGGVGAAGGYSLSYTTGETIIATLQAGVNLLSQGFQQPEQFGVVAVKLLDLTAVRLDRNTVLLQWNTATESNNSGFEVQRRISTEAEFTGRSFVISHAPGGTSTNPLHYAYKDANSFAGISYYRLQQTNLDGSHDLTVIKAVNGSSASEVTLIISPNPSKGSFMILVHGIPGNKVASITDISGKKIREITFGTNEKVTVTGLTTGMYIVTIVDAFGSGQNFSEKVVVQN